MSQPPNTPFQKVYDAVYGLLFDGDDNLLAQMVKPGNRVQLTENDINPFKSGLSTADIPELILIDEGANINLHANSSGSQVIQQLSIYCTIGTFRYAYVGAINWYIMCNLALWRSVIGSVTWRDVQLIKNIQMIPIQTGESNPIRAQAIAGFTSIWRMQLELRIPNENLVYLES